MTTPPASVARALRAIGRELRDARLQTGETAEALGRRIGVSRQTICKLERGAPGIAAGTMIAALQATRSSRDITREFEQACPAMTLDDA